MRVLIIGCGYVGIPLGAELARLGHEVFGLTRSGRNGQSMRERGIQPLRGDMTCKDDLEGLPLPFDWVVNTASAGRGGLEDYRRVYVDGMRNVLRWLEAAPPGKLVYTSSTSVYGQTDGSVVDESSSAEPESKTGRVLLEAEHVALEAARSKGMPAVILRAAGIYGPGRGHLLLQYLRGQARITGRGEGMLNMIHRDDLASSIQAALQSGRAGEIYNACDNEPVSQINFFGWLSKALGRDMPPFAREEEAAPAKRAVTNKQVSNRKLCAQLGIALRYPTFREGYAAEIQRLRDAGEQLLLGP